MSLCHTHKFLTLSIQINDKPSIDPMFYDQRPNWYILQYKNLIKKTYKNKNVLND